MKRIIVFAGGHLQFGATMYNTSSQDLYSLNRRPDVLISNILFPLQSGADLHYGLSFMVWRVISKEYGSSLIKLYNSTAAAGHPVIVPSVQQVKLHIRTHYSTVEQDGFWPAVFVK